MLVRLVVPALAAALLVHPRPAQPFTASAQAAAVVALVPMRRVPALAEPVELLTQHHLAVTMAVVRVELLPVGMAVPGLWSVA